MWRVVVEPVPRELVQVGLIGGAPEDLVGGAGGCADGWGPGELGVVVERLGEDVDVGGRAGCGGEIGEDGGVETGDVGNVVEVDVLEEVAELDAVFDAGCSGAGGRSFRATR